MTTGREILTSRSVTVDRSGNTTGTRRWTSEATSQAEIAAWLSSSQGIAFGGTYPGNGSLFLDRLEYQPQDDGTYAASGAYSPNGLFVLEKVNKQNNGNVKYVRWRFGTYDYTIDVPWQMKIKRTIPPSTTQQDVWAQNKQTVTKCDLLIEVEIRVPTLSLANVSAIAQQSGAVHRFPTLPSIDWRFMGGSIQNITDSEDLVSYQWRGDSGDYAYGSAAGQTPYNTQGGTVKFPDLNRPQHCVWITVPDPAHIGDPSFPFLFDYAQVCSIKPSGYSQLPYLTAAVSL